MSIILHQRTHFGCRIFDIRRTADRIEKIRHPKKGASDVAYSTSEEGCFGCRIFDIRRTANRMSKIRYPKKGASDVAYSTSEEGCFECRIFDGRLIECRIFYIRRRPISDRIFLHTSSSNVQGFVSRVLTLYEEEE